MGHATGCQNDGGSRTRASSWQMMLIGAMLTDPSQRNCTAARTTTPKRPTLKRPAPLPSVITRLPSPAPPYALAPYQLTRPFSFTCSSCTLHTLSPPYPTSLQRLQPGKIPAIHGVRALPPILQSHPPRLRARRVRERERRGSESERERERGRDQRKRETEKKSESDRKREREREIDRERERLHAARLTTPTLFFHAQRSP